MPTQRQRQMRPAAPGGARVPGCSSSRLQFRAALGTKPKSSDQRQGSLGSPDVCLLGCNTNFRQSINHHQLLHERRSQTPSHVWTPSVSAAAHKAHNLIHAASDNAAYAKPRPRSICDTCTERQRVAGRVGRLDADSALIAFRRHQAQGARI